MLCECNTSPVKRVSVKGVCAREHVARVECVDLGRVSAEFHKLSHTVSPAYTPTCSVENTIMAPHGDSHTQPRT